jgi:hypothetical protein
MRRGARIQAEALRGALVATTRETLDRVGPFDEGYKLYYEENDWQRRLRLLKGRLVWAGGARVVHLYNQSARTEPSVGAWFEESERRYFLTHFGERGRAALDAARGGSGADAPPSLPLLLDGALDLPAGLRPKAMVAVSPSPLFRPVLLSEIGEGEARWSLDPAVASTMRGGRWFARTFDPETLEVFSEGELPIG